jgi:hypothetical protein
MAEEIKSHPTSIEMVQSAPKEVDAGSDVSLSVKVVCASNCDLQGKTIQVLAHDETLLREIELTTSEEKPNETAPFTIQAPLALGACSWRIVFPEQKVSETVHETSSTSVEFTVVPHSTSLAVWDDPSPVVKSSAFRVKVGVKCSAQCKLTGKEVEVYDQAGSLISKGKLGETPWPQTSALYWTEAEMKAPAADGVYTWTVKYSGAALELPHNGSSSQFSFRTANPPEHVVTVQVVDKATQTPIEGAEVVMHPYRTSTDQAGVAKLEVPKGEFTLYVTTKYERPIFEMLVKVDSDQSIKAELLPVMPSPY